MDALYEQYLYRRRRRADRAVDWEDEFFALLKRTACADDTGHRHELVWHRGPCGKWFESRCVTVPAPADPGVVTGRPAAP